MSRLHVHATVDVRGVDLDLDVESGSVVAVLGPNGAGKSTLLGIVAGLIRPDHGLVELGGRTLTDTGTSTHVPPHRRSVALLAQQALLFPHMTALDNVAFAPRSAGLRRRAARERAETWLAAVDAVSLADRRPYQLSGGQAQRIAIARALAADPELLLLDEPMAALDVSTAPAVRSLLRTVLRESGRTALMVTHDPLDVLALADRAVVVGDGRIVEDGSVHDVLTRPRSAFSARIAGTNLLAGALVDAGVDTEVGVVHGVCDADCEPGAAGAAVFPPSAVAVYSDAPHGSPRNVLRVTVAELEARGATVLVRSGSGVAAEITTAAAADLRLEPGAEVWFVVKATEVHIHRVSARRGG
ncbi:sulfate/molybdate ABC transporter ATP-binding protein [Rhodococcus yananensis]|uniref:sulfate/molybdate ABC transporter ATP-binding protein n=1 Tax=Rhodococcus yananensis TaxID=2879464 RepID=UPI001CF8AF3A|nr:ATP-binding cassette domain-containing protein [Rhodococcus yananensis]